MKDQELVELCKRGDHVAQRFLYQKYVAPMTRLCYRYIQNESDTMDVLSEGFTKVFRLIHKFKCREGGSLKAWISKIMINESLMFLRKQKIRWDFDINEMQIAVEDYSINEIDAEYLYNAILALPDGYRTVFNLYLIEGYSHKEIARQLNITESASRSQLTHAKKKLKELLKK